MKMINSAGDKVEQKLNECHWWKLYSAKVNHYENANVKIGYPKFIFEELPFSNTRVFAR